MANGRLKPRLSSPPPSGHDATVSGLNRAILFKSVTSFTAFAGNGFVQLPLVLPSSIFYRSLYTRGWIIDEQSSGLDTQGLPLQHGSLVPCIEPVNAPTSIIDLKERGEQWKVLRWWSFADNQINAYVVQLRCDENFGEVCPFDG